MLPRAITPPPPDSHSQAGQVVGVFPYTNDPNGRSRYERNIMRVVDRLNRTRDRTFLLDIRSQIMPQAQAGHLMSRRTIHWLEHVWANYPHVALGVNIIAPTAEDVFYRRYAPVPLPQPPDPQVANLHPPQP